MSKRYGRKITFKVKIAAKQAASNGMGEVKKCHRCY